MKKYIYWSNKNNFDLVNIIDFSKMNIYYENMAKIIKKRDFSKKLTLLLHYTVKSQNYMI